MTAQDLETRPSRPLRRRWRVARWAVGLALAPILCALGVLLYLDERGSRATNLQVGDATALDRVDVFATVQRVDAANQQAQLRVEVVPHGAYAEPDSTVPAKALVVHTSSPVRTRLAFPAGQVIPAQDVTVGLAAGTISDYPFDRYKGTIAFAVEVADQAVPMSVTVDDIDPFVHLSAPSALKIDGGAGLEERVSRSRGTVFLAVFMMAAMWTLALAVVGGAWILVSQRRGLVWPALGWMAATLFALVGMRNAAPGGPPVGCLLDYAAFFWAELLVAVSVAGAVACGIVVERRGAA